MKHGKKYIDAAKLIENNKTYDPTEALELCCKTAKAKFDETVEVHIKLGVDAADQLLGVLRRAVQQLVRRDADRHIGHGCRNDEDQQHEQRRDPRADGVPGKKSCFGHVPLSASLYCRGVMPVLRRKVSEK